MTEKKQEKLIQCIALTGLSVKEGEKVKAGEEVDLTPKQYEHFSNVGAVEKL